MMIVRVIFMLFLIIIRSGMCGEALAALPGVN